MRRGPDAFARTVCDVKAVNATKTVTGIVPVGSARNSAQLGAIVIGVTAVAAQIILVRELIVAFYGNEICLGLMFASWLLWTALGSSVLGRYTTRTGNPRYLMAGLQAVVAVTLPATVLLVRVTRAAFQTVPGELLGPAPILLTSLATLSLFCVMSGWLFAAASRVNAAATNAAPELATGSVYLWEAIGSAIGGMLASILLAFHASSLQVALGVALLNLLSAAHLSMRVRLVRYTAISTLMVILILALPVVARLETWSEGRLWAGFRLLATRNSIYGKLAVIEAEGSRSLTENGLVSFTVPDPAAAEEAVHFAMLQHPAPKRLLLIGGGVNGSIEQALKHSGVLVDYVELDPAVFQLAAKYFPQQWEQIRSNDRVRVHAMDGRLFLKTVRDRFDVVIVNLPDPQSAQLNRFYTREFFLEAAGKLMPGGILSLQVRGAENYISPELAEFLACVRRTLREVFPEVTVIPGDAVHFFAARQPGTLTEDPKVLLARLRARHVQTSYVREYYIPFRMMPERVRDLEEQIHSTSAAPLNRDLAPVVYYFDTVLWSAQFSERYRQWFRSLARIRFATVAGTMAALLALVIGFLWRIRGQRRTRACAGFCVVTTGMTLMALQVLLLLGFQAMYGYVYHQLAILVAAFMLGMALGTWGSRHEISSRQRPDASMPYRRKLVYLQLAAAGSPLLLLLVLRLCLGVTSSRSAFLTAQVLFPVVALLLGAIGGYQFPVASKVYFGAAGGSGLGSLYGLDLAGAAVGALLISTYLVPVFGFRDTALLVAVANLFPAFSTAVLPLSWKVSATTD